MRQEGLSHQRKAVKAMQEAAETIRTAPRDPTVALGEDTVAAAHGAVSKQCENIEKMPLPYDEGLDLEFLKHFYKEEFLPISSALGHLLEHHIEEAHIEPLYEELRALHEELEVYEARLFKWLVETKQWKRLGGGMIQSAGRTQYQEMYRLTGRMISRLESLAKFLKYGWGPLLEGFELGRNINKLIEAAMKPESKETNEMAYYTMGTILAGCCLFCTLAVGLELAIIGAVLGIVGGAVMAFLEPLAAEKYVPLSQQIAQRNLRTGESAIQILRELQCR